MASILDTMKSTADQMKNSVNQQCASPRSPMRLLDGKKKTQEANAAKIVQKNVRGNSARKEITELKKENQWCKCFACFK